MLHGHTHLGYGARPRELALGRTRVIDVYGYVLLGPVSVPPLRLATLRPRPPAIHERRDALARRLQSQPPPARGG